LSTQNNHSDAAEGHVACHAHGNALRGFLPRAGKRQGI
jgi:hypothetical protein